MQRDRIDRLRQEHILPEEELYLLLSNYDEADQTYLAALADEVRREQYGTGVVPRGLIEISNICKNNCRYCGIRKGNSHTDRYRLSEEDIFYCLKKGYHLGFRSFVFQGGEDGYYSDEKLVPLIEHIRREYPDCAITLSLGERSKESYRRLFMAGADRYLLRHETAVQSHYERLHPQEMSFDNRIRCLYDLKEIGYQVGSGFMVGSPGQKIEYLVRDLLFLKELEPHMIGIGPFIPHQDTEYRGKPAGSLSMTLVLVSVLRLMHPEVLLPATTALGTLCEEGQILGVLAGANVLMPNLSPDIAKKNYMLYDNKKNTGLEAAEGIDKLNQELKRYGYHLDFSRGDYKKWSKNAV
ncbi:MAG: [FeFe] hydrogenase H-cluster radical SAM maturase HydE [Lachnospiraceae bacterium]|nr:[FeFe] hydrogenase H-cluster radical SAM maturase HydE [Lachnospiraceae bacterium]